MGCGTMGLGVREGSVDDDMGSKAVVDVLGKS